MTHTVHTKAGPIHIPVPDGWTVDDTTSGEVTLEGAVVPTKDDFRQCTRCQVTLRYDQATGGLERKCRLRRSGTYTAEPGYLQYGKTWKSGTSSTSWWVLKLLMENARGF